MLWASATLAALLAVDAASSATPAALVAVEAADVTALLFGYFAASAFALVAALSA